MLCRKRFLLLTFTAFRKAENFMAFACGRDLCGSGLNTCILAEVPSDACFTPEGSLFFTYLPCQSCVR